MIPLNPPSIVPWVLRLARLELSLDASFTGVLFGQGRWLTHLASSGFIWLRGLAGLKRCQAPLPPPSSPPFFPPAAPALFRSSSREGIGARTVGCRRLIILLCHPFTTPASAMITAGAA